jgi:hypothetical protein
MQSRARAQETTRVAKAPAWVLISVATQLVASKVAVKGPRLGLS